MILYLHQEETLRYATACLLLNKNGQNQHSRKNIIYIKSKVTSCLPVAEKLSKIAKIVPKLAKNVA